MIRQYDANFLKAAMENGGVVVLEGDVNYKARETEERSFLQRMFGRKPTSKIVEKTEHVKFEVAKCIGVATDNFPAGSDSLIERFPFVRVWQLDPKFYGDGLYLAQHYNDGDYKATCYEVLAADGHSIGIFDISQFKVRGQVYSPSLGDNANNLRTALMPSEVKIIAEGVANGQDDRQIAGRVDEFKRCPAITLKDVIVAACEDDKRTIQHVPDSAREHCEGLDASLQDILARTNKSATLPNNINK